MWKFLYYLILIGFLSFFTHSANAQTRKTGNLFKSGVQRTRHLQGLKGADFSYGLSEHGRLYSLGGMFYMLDNNSVRVKGYYEDARVFGDRLVRYTADFNYAYSPVDLSGFVFVNLIGGVTVNHTSGDLTENLSIDNGMNFGALAGIELEAFFAGMASFFIQVDQRVHVYANYGRWRNYSTLGLRINFK